MRSTRRRRLALPERLLLRAQQLYRASQTAESAAGDAREAGLVRELEAVADRLRNLASALGIEAERVRLTV